MIDQKFCDTLERVISNCLLEYSDKTIKTICPDGIWFGPTDQCFVQKFVNDNKYVTLRLYAITGSVATYTLILLFGRKSLSRYARGLDLLSCIPAHLNETNMQIDFKKAEIIVQLL